MFGITIEHNNIIIMIKSNTIFWKYYWKILQMKGAFLPQYMLNVNISENLLILIVTIRIPVYIGHAKCVCDFFRNLYRILCCCHDDTNCLEL